MKISLTQLAVLGKCAMHDAKGNLYCPVGADFKRAHALVRLGLIEPIHGRKGEGEEQFRPTEEGKELFPTAYRLPGSLDDISRSVSK
jgi:hypothetical protein